MYKLIVLMAFLFLHAATCNDCGGYDTSICHLPLRTGSCPGVLKRYGYDVAVHDCVEFTYGGCDGNANNFDTYNECIVACG
ncbi:trypsin inhibitor-like [Galleria mellonella]|uniref:Trypsin inhibitor-like n=1 Tax=Galleria mellonella TaxID=7137 RepID=A0A6J3CC63_GALME|nr:trypsin inhibitor-like [Galleria mellonella]